MSFATMYLSYLLGQTVTIWERWMLDLSQGRKDRRSLAADVMRRVMCVAVELCWTATAVACLNFFDIPRANVGWSRKTSAGLVDGVESKDMVCPEIRNRQWQRFNY
jgi:hypothetical protein